jgi:hypothetical protein
VDAGTGAQILTQINDISVEVGIPITVEVTVPHENVDIVPVPFVTELEPENWKLGASATMTKEGF